MHFTSWCIFGSAIRFYSVGSLSLFSLLVAFKHLHQEVIQWWYVCCCANSLLFMFSRIRVTQEEKAPRERKARKWVSEISKACRLWPHNKILKVHFQAACCSLQSFLAMHSLTLGYDNGHTHNYSHCAPTMCKSISSLESAECSHQRYPLFQFENARWQQRLGHGD